MFFLKKITLKLGEMIQFDNTIFQLGLKIETTVALKGKNLCIQIVFIPFDTPHFLSHFFVFIPYFLGGGLGGCPLRLP